MGYFFRKSASFGPFRLNFSKSGIGASVGVKGARITMNSRGTTYVTVGSNGFYYRETLSNRGCTQGPPPLPPQSTTHSDQIASADVSELVDSSSEKLLQQLNARANMFNPAWIFYIAAASSILFGLSSISTTTAEPIESSLPNVTSPFGADRKDNTSDEYQMLVTRYGNPDSILSTSSGTMVTSRTTYYRPAEVRITLAPNGCVEAYEKAATRPLRLARSRKRTTEACAPSPGWAIVGYFSGPNNLPISSDAAIVLLDKVVVKRTAIPSEETGISPEQARMARSVELATKAHKPNAEADVADLKPELQPDRLRKALDDRRRRRQEVAERRALLPMSLALLLGVGLTVGGIVVHKKNSERRRTRLIYELNSAEKQKYGVVQQALAHLSQCQRIWRIESESGTADWKRNAGASSLIHRTPVSVHSAMPRRVEVSVPVSCLGMRGLQLFFLPDFILCRQGNRYGSIAYKDCRVDQGVQRYIESEGVPGDAIVVDRTWRYVNKNGSPDRRFNSNVQLPVAQYGTLVLSSPSGLNLHLYTSSTQQSGAFSQCWLDLNGGLQGSGQTRSRSSYSPPPLPPRQTPPTARAQALRLFGLNDGASRAEITAAYYRLAQQCHPDKVAGLAREFQALADAKMKELNAAYQLLKS